MDETTRCVHFLFSGRVQGVGFRAVCRDTALSLGIQGWVRNLASGDVECVVQGSTELIETFEARIGTGSGWIRVDRIERHDRPVDPSMHGFHITW